MLASRVLLSIAVVVSLAVLSLAHADQPEHSAGVVASAVPAILTVDAPAGPHPANKPVDVTISVADAADLAAFEFGIGYDRALLTLNAVTLSPGIGAQTGCNPEATRCVRPLGPLENATQSVFGAYSFGPGPGYTGAGTLATLHFEPRGSAGVVALHLADALLVDSKAVSQTPTTVDALLVLDPPVSGSHTVFLPFTRK